MRAARGRFPYPHLLQFIMGHSKRFQLKRLALAMVGNEKKPIHFAMARVVRDVGLLHFVIYVMNRIDVVYYVAAWSLAGPLFSEFGPFPHLEVERALVPSNIVLLHLSGHTCGGGRGATSGKRVRLSLSRCRNEMPTRPFLAYGEWCIWVSSCTLSRCHMCLQEFQGG